MHDNEFFKKISIIEKVTDKDSFEELYSCEPFVCKIMLDKFMSFLDDPDFDKAERQIILLKFLKNNYPLELSRDVVEYAQSSRYSNDYVRVIMEWNYECSDFIKQYSLFNYDSSQLAFDKKTKYFYDMNKHRKDKQIDIIADIAGMLINKKQEG